MVFQEVDVRQCTHDSLGNHSLEVLQTLALGEVLHQAGRELEQFTTHLQ